MHVTVYGIPNCDTVRKARAWLVAHEITYTFHDFKKAGLERTAVHQWLQTVPRDILVNRKGTTWRALDANAQAGAADDGGALELMLAHPSVIKRPVLVIDGAQVEVGFSPAAWQALFAQAGAQP